MQNNQLGTKRSPVSNDGRGLKRWHAFDRQSLLPRSPVSNDGRGLKQRYEVSPPDLQSEKETER